MGTKNDPGDFDFYHNALPDEPMFILLARDPNAPELVERWADGRERSIAIGARPSADTAMVDEARQCAANMRDWRRTYNGVWRNRPAASSPDEADGRELALWMRRHIPHETKHEIADKMAAIAAWIERHIGRTV